MNYSSHNNELSLPLIGTLPQEAALEQNESQTPKKSNTPIKKTTADAEQDCIKTDKHGCCDFVLSSLLYVLLFLQFGTFFYVQDEEVNDLDWTVVNWSIVMFIVATYLFRNALTEIGVSCDAAVLLPEITIVLAMGIAFFFHVLPAFLLLVAGKLFMALTVVCINVYRLCTISEDQPENPEAKEDSLV